jgi:hypothetical protein
MNLDSDPRVGKAGHYRYCRRCGAMFHRPLDAAFHFGEEKWHSGGAKGQEYSRIPCSGKPVGKPIENPAPGRGRKRVDLTSGRAGEGAWALQKRVLTSS